jgi:hypothetical protein
VPRLAAGSSPGGAQLPYGKLLDHFQDELGGSAVVDGSKHPSWLRAVLADQPADPDRMVTFVTARSPFAFCDSYRVRTGCPIWQAANIWRDVYYDGLRQVNRAGLPHLVVRYESFALEPESVLRPACALLGIDYQVGMRFFQGLPSHDIGGNLNVFAAVPDLGDRPSVAAFQERMPERWTKLRHQSESYWGKPFGGWVDDKWQTHMSAEDLEQIMQTPGLVDVANLLGYELTREVTAWQQRQLLTD